MSASRISLPISDQRDYTGFPLYPQNRLHDSRGLHLQFSSTTKVTRNTNRKLSDTRHCYNIAVTLQDTWQNNHFLRTALYKAQVWSTCRKDTFTEFQQPTRGLSWTSFLSKTFPGIDKWKLPGLSKTCGGNPDHRYTRLHYRDNTLDGTGHTITITAESQHTHQQSSNAFSHSTATPNSNQNNK